MKIKYTILAGCTALIAACTTPLDLPPQHSQELGTTTASYLQANYSVSAEISEADGSYWLSLTCSPGSSLKLLNIKWDGNLQLLMIVGIQTTHPTSVGTFYYNDVIPLTVKTVPSHLDTHMHQLFWSDKMSFFCSGKVFFHDNFLEQLKLLNDDPKAFNLIEK